MLFNSFIFLIFLAFVIPLFHLLPSKKYRNIFLLLCSYFFYGYWDWRFCFLLLISTLSDFVIGKLIHQSTSKQQQKWLLILSLFINLSILCIFKYFNFFIDSFQSIANSFHINPDFLHIHVLLPVGISFYTFQTLSYTIDIYRKKLAPTNNFIDFSLFVAFFPQLVAGPIERAKDLLPQLSKKINPSKNQIEKGIVLIVFGLFRKVIIGDTAGKFVDQIFAQPELYMSFELIAGLILFSIQIYADFSGYSHIARGTANLLGIELMRNFEQPYFARNITDFWRRWHISLSTWLKDYVYISLGGNRHGKFRTYINLMLTMLLGGLWHVASWNFVVCGGLHGIYLVVHKLIINNKKVPDTNQSHKKFTNKVQFFINASFTYILVLFAWLFFRATTWDAPMLILHKIFVWEGSTYSLQFLRIIFGFTALIVIVDFFEYKTQKHAFLLNIKSKPIRLGIICSLFFIVILFLLKSEPMPFVYFQF